MTAPNDLDPARLERWRSAQPAGWRSRWPVLGAWVVLFVTSTVLTKEGGCTPAHPCASSWGGAVDLTLALAAPVLVLWRPRLGVLVSLVAVAAFLSVELRLDDLRRPVVLGLSALVLLALLPLARQLIAQRRREEELARQESIGRWPGRTVPVGAGGVGRYVGGALLVIGLLFGVYAFHRDRVDRQDEQRASVVAATVVSHDDDGYAITVEIDGQRYDLDTNLASDYPVGSQQPVYVDTDLVRLVAAPHDETGWLAIGMGLAILGATLAGLSAMRRRELEQLLATPQPQLRVRLHESLDDLVVLSLDGEHALVTALVLDPDRDPSPSDDEPVARLDLSGPALLHGRPVPGRPVALRLEDGTELLPYGTCGHVDENWRSAVLPDEEDDWGAGTWEVPVDVVPVDSWRVPWWRRLLGATLSLGCLAGAFAVCALQDSVFQTLYELAGLTSLFVFLGLGPLLEDVTLDDDALVVDERTRRTRYPWEALRKAVAMDGQVGVVGADDELLTVLPWPTALPWPLVGRGVLRAQRHAALLRRRMATADGAAEVTHEPRPATAVLAVAFVLSALAGLYFRGAV